MGFAFAPVRRAETLLAQARAVHQRGPTSSRRGSKVLLSSGGGPTPGTVSYTAACSDRRPDVPLLDETAERVDFAVGDSVDTEMRPPYGRTAALGAAVEANVLP